jgi:hypothetical protein
MEVKGKLFRRKLVVENPAITNQLTEPDDLLIYRHHLRVYAFRSGLLPLRLWHHKGRAGLLARIRIT